MLNQTLPQLDELYKEIILDHYRSPYGRLPLEKTDYFAEGLNPLCGDEIKLGLQMNNNKIDRIHIECHGCSISVASGSMLAQVLEGKTIDQAKKIAIYLKDMMHGIVTAEVEIGDLESLKELKNFLYVLSVLCYHGQLLKKRLLGMSMLKFHSYFKINGG